MSTPLCLPQRLAPRGACRRWPLLPLLLAALAAVRSAWQLVASALPAAAFAQPPAAARGAAARLPRSDARLLRGRTALAARGGAEGEEEAEAEEDDDDYEFVPAEVIGAPKVGQKFEGVVTNVLDFGAFVDIGTDKQGLVPRSKIQDGFTENVADVVKVGDGVTVWVSAVDGDRLTLSMSKSKIFSNNAPRADLSLFADIDSSEWLPGTVVNVREFGAFVSVKPSSGGEAAAQGLVHITQLKDGFVESVADEVSVGDEVQVRVLSVDPGANRMALSMKPEGAPRSAGPDLGAFAEVPETKWLDGTVKGLANFGAFVEVQPPGGGAPAQGLVHITQITEGFIEDPAEELEVDQEVKVRILSVDADAGKMSLTMKAAAE